MQKLNNYIKFIILILFSHLYSNVAFAEVFSAPTLSKPSAPGTFGARHLDWSVSDLGEVGYSIPIAAPALKQLSMNLSLNYSPTHAYGDAGAFWNFSLMKVSLDLKRGQTQFLTRNLCTQSMADNLYINGTKLIPQSPGVWMTSLNSGRDILKCHENGFVFYKSTGDIFHFGLTSESISMTASGEAIEWLISKHSTFRGKQEIFYEYEKPTGQPTEFGLSNTNIPNLYAKPMLKRIYSDDVELQIQYQENSFKNLHFYGGIPQILFGRVSEISVLKNTHLLHKYVFQYENSSKFAFSRLYSMQELGSDGKSTYPKTIFSYRGSNSTISNELSSVNEKFDRSFPSFSDNYFKFADLLSTGKSQMLFHAGSDSFWLTSFDPTKVFAAEPNGGLVTTQKIKVRLEAYAQYSKNLKDLQFVDLMGTGTTDIYSSNGANPVILLNDRKFNEKGELIFKRYARLSRDDFDFLRQCGLDPRKWKTLNLTGQGRSDFICIGNKNAFILINKGIKLVDAKENRYEIIAKRLKVKLDYNLQSTLQDDYAIIDWNADGLSDLLVNHGNSIYLLLNTGNFAKGENQSSFFEKVNLGLYRYLGGIKASKMLIGDFTGTGLPSINFKHSRFLINHGLGKPLTELYIENIKKFNPEYAAVVQLTGTGKQQIFAATPATHGNAIIELASRSFPNHLHSVVSADGRFLSFNYTSSVLENQEAITTEQNAEVKQLEMQQPIMPVVLPLLKQIGFSDGINPTRMTRYAYRLPRFDSYLNKYLGFSLVRKQNVGDETQLGTLQEKRFLSGVRLSEVEKFSGFVDYRLQSEKNVIQHEMLNQCLNPSLTAENTQWCTDLAGFSYYSKSGATNDSISFATGLLNTKEIYTETFTKFELKLFQSHDYPENLKLASEKPELAFIVNKMVESEKKGDNYLNLQKIYGKVTNYFDEKGRILSTVTSNPTELMGDEKVVNFSYFCPLTHPENLNIFCDQVEFEQKTSSLGNVKSISKKIVYDLLTGNPLEEWLSNQDGQLTLQANVSYDQFGRIKKIKKGSGEFSEFEWENNNNNLSSILDHDNIKSIAIYDELGYIKKVESNRGNISAYEYDSFGRVTQISTNHSGTVPLKVIHIVQDYWDIFLNWLKKIFSANNNSEDDSPNTSLVSSDLKTYVTEKYEYQFPEITFTNSNSFDAEIENLNQFDVNLDKNPNAYSYHEGVLGKFKNHKFIPGHIIAYKRNHNDENLELVSKLWLTGDDESLYSAVKTNKGMYSISNKSKYNSLGNIYKEFLNLEISHADIINNNLPSQDSFKLRTIYQYYADGGIKSEIFADGLEIKHIDGVDYDELITPAGRKNRNIYNSIGQVIQKQLGLNSQSSITDKTLISNISYDAFGRIKEISNNDNLLASQSFGHNNLVEFQNHNGLGVSRFFYDNYGRLNQNLICPVGTNIEDCNILTSAKLSKAITYSNTGKVKQEEFKSYNRNSNTNSVELISYTFGTLANQTRNEDLGLPIEIKISSQHNIGYSESIKKLSHNRIGLVANEDLEIFVGKTQNDKKSIGVYQVERVFDLSSNLVQLKSRGGFSRENLNKLKTNYFTGYSVSYESGTNKISQLSFLQNGVAQSVPLEKVEIDSEGYIKSVQLSNNLLVKSCWHHRKEVPLSMWVGNSQMSSFDICDDNVSQVSQGLFHNKIEYDEDLYPVSVRDLSKFNKQNSILSADTNFSYDIQGRLIRAQGINENSWGQIDYEYSLSGRIQKISRSGNFVKNRISKSAGSLNDSYSYSSSGQIGVLSDVHSSDGFESANLKFQSDNLGFRNIGVIPSLSVFGEQNKNISWKNKNEIPMQKYEWNGRGLIAGTYEGIMNKEDQFIQNDLINFKISDENGGTLAELDGIEFFNDTNETQDKFKTTKLPRSVYAAQGISFERDEIHFNINIGAFTSLRLITRYPTLNALNPTTISDTHMQTRKELVIKDQVSSISQVIDIDTQKVVERNTTEPYGLSKGIPLIGNSILSDFKTNNKRADVSLYVNSQSNMRDDWNIKSFESINQNDDSDKKGMRNSTIFATGKFSHSTGLSTMGVRTFDPARGQWISPDIHVAQNFSTILSSPIEQNLFQYALNNPVQFNDPSGKIAPLVVYGVFVGTVHVVRFVQTAMAVQRVVQAATVVATAGHIASNIPVKIQSASIQNTANIGTTASVSISMQGQTTNNIDTQKKAVSLTNSASKVDKCAPNFDLRSNQAKGRSAEEQYAAKYNLTKNTKTYQTSIGNTIPDFVTPSKFIEIKNVNKQGWTAQLRRELEAAKANGKTLEVVVDERTKISSKLDKLDSDPKSGLKVTRENFQNKKESNNPCKSEGKESPNKPSKDNKPNDNSNTGASSDSKKPDTGTDKK
ncbi:hypothetical protein GCL60_12480 [Silvanigrella paludirubra]|uniref:Tox-REase-7 domain-containing protein n=1 Tax=Silvanigrella paludirubra TaxID=2499159 RepID=A0A6N6VUW4_9BACT|nr:putative toxin [Silvanigrella paludirubra]KAB8037981.1 hypothetical protein GCL60_12480 [Silvanigrella paludirubra]